MHDCSWASHRDDNNSFAAIRQALCWVRHDCTQGSATAIPDMAAVSSIAAMAVCAKLFNSDATLDIRRPPFPGGKPGQTTGASQSTLNAG
jgi:hypothetical protein